MLVYIATVYVILTVYIHYYVYIATLKHSCCEIADTNKKDVVAKIDWRVLQLGLQFIDGDHI